MFVSVFLRQFTSGLSSRLEKKSTIHSWKRHPLRLGVKLREKTLKIWTRYKQYYEERNVVDLQREIFQNMNILVSTFMNIFHLNSIIPVCPL